MTTLESVLADFDNEFGFLKAVHSTSVKQPIDRIHDFITDSLKTLASELVEAVPEKKDRLCKGHWKCKNKEKHYHILPEELAWNSARLAIITKAKELGLL